MLPILIRRARQYRISKQNFLILAATIISLYIYTILILQASLGKSSRREKVINNLERCFPNIYGTIVKDPSKMPAFKQRSTAIYLVICLILVELLTYVPKDGVPIESIENRLLIEENLNIKLGGKFRPLSCKPVFKVAFIVPYRDRLESLQCFLDFFHPFLIDQNIEYGIYLVEPNDEKLTFNRGLLMNIGFTEALKDEPDYDCFFFHDVDMIPQDKRIIYECNNRLPKHFAVAVSKFNYK